LLLDDLNPRTVRPDLELVRSRRSKRIRGTDQNLISFVFDPLCKLANGCRFSDTVYADYHQNVRLDRCVDGPFVDLSSFLGMMKDFQEFIFHSSLESGQIINLLP